MTEQPPTCICGREIVRNQYCRETDEQFQSRLASNLCWPKCGRTHGKPKKERAKPTLALVSSNYQRPEGVTQVKQKTPRSESYKAFIREQPCLLKDKGYGPCVGDVVPHHTESGGTSIKGSDFSCVPLCCAHHLVMDNAGKKGRGVWTERELKAIVRRLNRQWTLKTGKIPGEDHKQLTRSGTK